MASLFADRFLETGSRMLDLATGARVSVRCAQPGSRADQAVWAEACGELLGAPKRRCLIDFGLVGAAQRFEAYRAAPAEWTRARSSGWASRPSIVAQAIEWLDGARARRSSTLTLPSAGPDWLEVLAREARLRGFVPVGLTVLENHRDVVRKLIDGHSVLVLEARGNDDSGKALSRAFLTLLESGVRDAAAIVLPVGASTSLKSRRPLHAAEGRAVYEAARSEMGAPAPDARAAALLTEGRRHVACGRHAAAERALRAARAAFERRHDLLHAGDSADELGCLLLTRGRASEAQAQFETARAHFQQRGAERAAVRACVHAGLAQTDAALLDAADETLRAADAAASALADEPLVQLAAVALARNLYWQARYGDARARLERITPGPCPRYWSLLCRIRLAQGQLDAASQCVCRARQGLRDGDGLEAVVRHAQAMLQARLGDVDALSVHALAGMRSAGRAHLPLLALRVRLTLVDGLLEAGLRARARTLGRCTETFSRASLPALLKRRVESVHARLHGHECERSPGPTVREQPPVFDLAPMDGVAELLSVCHDVADEREALTSAAALVRRHASAVAAGVFGIAGGRATSLGAAGVLNGEMAQRCIDLGLAIVPEATSGGVEAAVPIHHLGQTLGAIALRWTLDGPGIGRDALALARVAAAACAPLVQILLERHAGRDDEAPAGHPELIGTSAAIDDVRRLIARAANAPFTVLIEGESGSGKELVARAIHRAGARRDRRLCALNCAALTEELIDTELFGHAKNAFTGAASERLGLFEAAEGGTVFLDEVGELSARAQAKLLRALQEGEIRRIGENFTRPIDARLIAATNRSLQSEVEAGRFRKDLLYRLDVIRITVPPLRERVEDIPTLARRFWSEAAARTGTRAVLGQGALSALARYDWPGNVRELQNVLTALAVSVSARGVIAASAMPAAIARAMKPADRETLETARRRFERRFVRAALARAAGHRGETATALGLSRQGLAKLMQRLQLDERWDGGI